MTLLYFPWASLPDPQTFKVKDICHTIRHEYGGGYTASRRDGTKIQKEIYMKWDNLTGPQWLAIVEFYRSVGGSAEAFYFEFPVGLYGSPGYGGYANLEPPDGFDNDAAVGYGNGPIMIARFDDDELSQEYYYDHFQHWIVEATVREIA